MRENDGKMWKIVKNKWGKGYGKVMEIVKKNRNKYGNYEKCKMNKRDNKMKLAIIKFGIYKGQKS